MGGGTEGGEEREKRELWRKEKNGCGYQKDSAHLLRFLSQYLKALREGGRSLSSVTPPIIKNEPH